MGLARVQSVISYEPDIVLLELGANDYLQSLSPEITRKNLESIIKILDDKKIQIILVNVSAHPLLPFPNKEAYNNIMPELATKYGLSLVSSFLEDILGTDSLMLEDRIHPTAQGYTKALNQNLWPVLQKQLVK
jgi:acyl-CoA thioesterase I